MRGRWLAGAAVAALAVGAAVLTLALRGDGEPSPGGGGETAPSRLQGPAGFATAMARPGTVTINVHVPDEGSIRGTDLAIPYDLIEVRRAQLPARGTPLAVYCRSGRMSTIAVRTLARLGYTELTELDGGMEAWAVSGRPLLPPA